MADMDIGSAVTLLAHLGKIDLDQYVVACPQCGGGIRTEVRVEARPMSEVLTLFNVTEEQLRASGAKVDAFGRVKAAVPYGTCMGCGHDYDMTDSPEPNDSETGADR